jgi:hypothetical protein
VVAKGSHLSDETKRKLSEYGKHFFQTPEGIIRRKEMKLCSQPQMLLMNFMREVKK